MSDIKPVLERVEEAPEEWLAQYQEAADLLALAACVRDLAEFAEYVTEYSNDPYVVTAAHTVLAKYGLSEGNKG